MSSCNMMCRACLLGTKVNRLNSMSGMHQTGWGTKLISIAHHGLGPLLIKHLSSIIGPAQRRGGTPRQCWRPRFVPRRARPHFAAQNAATVGCTSPPPQSATAGHCRRVAPQSGAAEWRRRVAPQGGAAEGCSRVAPQSGAAEWRHRLGAIVRHNGWGTRFGGHSWQDRVGDRVGDRVEIGLR